MGVFNYLVYDAQGSEKRGVLEGDSARQIRQQLRDKGLVPVEVSEVVGAKAKRAAAKSNIWTTLFGRGMSTADLALITRLIATLLASGSPIEECLWAVGQQMEKTKIKRMIRICFIRVGFSQHTFMAMFKYSDDFPPNAIRQALRWVVKAR